MSNQNPTKNDLNWGKVFDKYDVLNKIQEEGKFEISSAQINEFREARLMTKFDHHSQLPRLFADNKLSILPTSRGSYVIGNYQTFSKFESIDGEIESVNFPMLESLDYRNITSESAAINSLFASNILQRFTDEECLVPTVNGRMSSSVFSFNVKNSKCNNLELINVDKSQIEIDGGYEGDKSLILIEAKNYISDDFLIRQLYYPYRLWEAKVNKTVRPVFLTYSNGVFDLREYRFDSVQDYNSIVLVKQQRYEIYDRELNMVELQMLISTVTNVQEPVDIPFPQADSFERIINLCELIRQNDCVSSDDITENYDFDSRQTGYYTNAARYLGFVEKVKESKPVEYRLTKEGQQLFEVSLVERQRKFVAKIIEHKVFKDVISYYLTNGNPPNKDVVVEFMKQAGLYNVESETTYRRRASTILHWVGWILEQLEA